MVWTLVLARFERKADWLLCQDERFGFLLVEFVRRGSRNRSIIFLRSMAIHIWTAAIWERAYEDLTSVSLNFQMLSHFDVDPWLDRWIWFPICVVSWGADHVEGAWLVDLLKGFFTPLILLLLLCFIRCTLIWLFSHFESMVDIQLDSFCSFKCDLLNY